MKKLTPHLRQRKTSASSVSTQPLPSRRSIHKKRSKKKLWLISGISMVFLLLSGFMYSFNQEKTNKAAYSLGDQSNSQQPTSEKPLYSSIDEDENEESSEPIPSQSTANNKATTTSSSEVEKAQKPFSSKSHLEQTTQATKQKQTQVRSTQSKSTDPITASTSNKGSEPSTKKEGQNNQQQPTVIPSRSTEDNSTKSDRAERKKRQVRTDKAPSSPFSPPPWNPKKEYKTGDTVLYQGKIYIATWSNQNKKPGDSFFGFQYWSELKVSS
jgi:hypothetical protein